MKIGIITFWESTDNYGQVLQAYALQKVLKNMGHEPFLIRYSLKASLGESHKPSLLRKVIKVMTIYPMLKAIKRNIRQREDIACRNKIEEKNISRKFSEFRDKNISYSEFIYNSIEELKENPPQADCYITGSDQVWTMLLSIEGNAAYYLDFGKEDVLRISYAASFGRPYYPIELQSKLSYLLKKFKAISVREKEGIDICTTLGLKATLVLDPTLLLKKEDYLYLCTNNDNSKRKIYVYSINIRTPQELYWEEVKKYAYENDLPIIVTTSSGNIPGREIYKDVDYSYSTISEWIMQINNAELVVTTSFHGVVFCLLMHTNFVYVPLKSTGAKGNGRVESLLSSVGLKNKQCLEKGKFKKCVSTGISWDIVDRNIERLRKASFSFLTNALNK